MKRKLPFAVLSAALVVPTLIAPIQGFADTTTTKAESGLYFTSTTAGEQGAYYSFEDWAALTTVEKGLLLAKYGTENVQVYLDSLNKITTLKVISDSGKPFLQAAVDFKETDIAGEFKNGKTGEVITIGEQTPAPGEELTVESVSAITTTAVEINITALTEDDEALEVEVKDNNRNVVATKTAAVSAGETTVTVEFVTAVKAADLVGVWTVNGVEFNLDVVNQLEAIIEALTGGDLALYNALEAASIKNIDDNLVSAYKGALAEEELTSLEAVQAVIDKVNADNVSATEAVALVKEVFGAQANEVTLSKVLANNFDRVNSKSITVYKQAISTLFSEQEPAIVAVSDIDAENSVALLKGIQAAIDAVNLEAVATAFAAVESTIDTSKFGEVRTLINTYKVAPEEGAVDLYGYMTDVLDYQTAIAAVTTASTNSALLNALNKLDAALVQYTEKYDGKAIENIGTGFKNGADNFDLTKVKTDATSLTAYRLAIKEVEEVGLKNQAKDILDIIVAENGELSGAAITTALKNLNEVNAATTASKVVEYLKAAQDLDSDLTAQTKKEIKSAYAEAYKTEVLAKLATGVVDSDPVAYEKFEAVSEVNILVGSVNDTQDATALLKALNDATTAAQVSSALIDLKSEAFINVHADDKLTVAAAVLAARDALTSKKFDTVTNTYAAAVTVAVEARTEALGLANELNSDSTITNAQAVLAEVAPTTYAALSNQAKVDAAQTLLDSLEFSSTDAVDGAFPLKSKFKTLKAVLTAAGL